MEKAIQATSIRLQYGQYIYTILSLKTSYYASVDLIIKYLR